MRSVDKTYYDHDPSDAELLKKYRETHDQEFLARLYERHLAFLLGVCMKYLKDEEKSHDAVMDIYEKLIVPLREKVVDRIKPWLYTTAKNHCLMQLRKKEVEKLSSDAFEINGQEFMRSGSELHPNEKEDKEMYLSWLEDCLDQLKEEQRKCVDSFFLKGNCYKTVADQTGFELKTVRSHIQNGKRNLEICMNKKYERQAE